MYVGSAAVKGQVNQWTSWCQLSSLDKLHSSLDNLGDEVTRVGHVGNNGHAHVQGQHVGELLRQPTKGSG